MTRNILVILGLSASVGLAGCNDAGASGDQAPRHGGWGDDDDDGWNDDDDGWNDDDDDCGSCGEGEGKNKPERFNTGTRNLHLERTVRFHPIQPGSDPDNGRSLFGSDPTQTMEDTSNALFEGLSMTAQKQITSNGRTCFTCHLGDPEDWGLPDLPLSDHVDVDTNTLFTEIDADAGGDPDGFDNLNERGLVKYRVNRFDPRVTADPSYLQVFAWRKVPTLRNIGLSQGFLNDQRGRVMFETARGAVFSHTQSEDDRFDDLFTIEDANDMEAFQFGLFTDPALAALRDPNDPMFDAMVEDPFLTVDLTTKAQKRGKKVFKNQCFACHNTPQVFSALDNVEPLANGDRPPQFPSWAPAVGKTYNIGVAEANFHNLRFTRFVAPDDFEDIVLELANEDGSIEHVTAEFDLGLAMTTGRTEDVGRFKVPQLRNLVNNGPYMHDNSLATIEDVVNYKCSADYNDSKDGQYFPIGLTSDEKADLIEFLYAL